MRIYRVGGAVRDELLGLPVSDRDWVVVGATPQMMLDRGFKPVGRDFPVFLHPDTNEEYALARTERKSGPGYRGFVTQSSPDVTLEDDLRRRDLTINAMAMDDHGAVVDPWGGRADLQARLLRHVSEAFLEDPVRILRTARFAARFSDFEVAAETAALMRRMVSDGEADHLVAERVWQELARGLMTPKPSRMLEVLHDSGALARIAPELAAGWNAALATVLDAAAAQEAPLAVRWAVLLHRLSPATVDALCERLRVPVDLREIARAAVRERTAVMKAESLEPSALVALVERLDALRRPQRMVQVLQAIEYSACTDNGDACGDDIDTDAPGPVGEVSRSRNASGPPRAVRASIARVRAAAQVIAGLDAGAIARSGPPATIASRLQEARVQALRAALGSDGVPTASATGASPAG